MGDTIAYITVGVFGGLCAIAIIILAICIVRRKRLARAAKEQQAAAEELHNDSLPVLAGNNQLRQWMEYGDSFQFKIPRPEKYVQAPGGRGKVALDEPHYPSSLHGHA
jgi:type VI protein secretion system component VasK